MTSVRVKLAGAPGPFAEVRICEGDTIARLAERACATFPSWRLDASQVFLHLLAAGGDEEPAQGAAATALTGGSSHLASGWSLARAGVSPGAWLLARAASTLPALPRTVTLVVPSEDEFGERGTTSLGVTLSSQEELRELVESHGGGSLVALGASTAARRLEELVPGGAYTLVGGVGVVKPNGSGHTYIPAPPPLSLAEAPRRSLALAGEAPALHCGCSIA